MKNERYGVLLDPKAHITIGLDSTGAIDSLHLLNEDIVVTVNEIMKDGKCRLAVSAPGKIKVVKEEIPSNPVSARTNILHLQRQLGCSVIIRRQAGVSAMDAIRDLRRNGIKIYNSTKSLLATFEKTGSDLDFVADETIWKIIRMELTFLRRA